MEKPEETSSAAPASADAPEVEKQEVNGAVAGPLPPTESPADPDVSTSGHSPAATTDIKQPQADEKLEQDVGKLKLDDSAEAAEATPTKPTEETPQEPAAAPTVSSATAIPKWPDLSSDHPLSKFLALLPNLLQEADYAEVYGVDLSAPNSFQTKLILQKFLRANANDLDKAKAQLLSTLKWRKEFQPLKCKDEVFSRKRFGGLGYVLLLDNVPGVEKGKKDIATFNIYGAVKDNKATFEDLNGFLRWRVGLMELSLSHLDLPNATQPVPDHGQGSDPYQLHQIHDYLSVSFLRMDPYAKAASKKVIEVFRDYYPETLSRKFFVNVPVVMGWMFKAMSLILPKETTRKFTVLSYGEELVKELGDGLPKAYGGKGPELEEEGETVKLADE